MSQGIAGSVVAGGVTLETMRWEGVVESPTLVLLHEGLGCVALWRGFPAALAGATGLPVVAYSRAGYGQSGPAALPRPVDYMTREALDVLPQVLDAIGPGPVILLGHSDGATIAAEYAGRVADRRVRGVILMAPHFFTEPMGLSEIARARDVFDAGDLGARMARYHRDPVATFRGWNDAWLNPDFRAWDVTEVIDTLRVPVLAIQGRQDQYGTLAQVEVVEARSYAPVDLLVLDSCRHAPHEDQPQAVLAAIAEFCARLVRIEAAQAPGL